MTKRATGPSPRGRGNLFGPLQANVRCRAIPAWAGKPWTCLLAVAMSAGHPRVGGETATIAARMEPATGPSPRGRGNQLGMLPQFHMIRAIPAWAGKPPRDGAARLSCGGHPRVGGETLSGTPGLPGQPGPSPRGRGNPNTSACHYIRSGAIPAWAGKPPRHCRRCRAPGGHPRVGGETQRRVMAGLHKEGPSPRGRGNRAVARGEAVSARAIPAWAGKPRQTKALSFFDCQTTLVS